MSAPSAERSSDSQKLNDTQTPEPVGRSSSQVSTEESDKENNFERVRPRQRKDELREVLKSIGAHDATSGKDVREQPRLLRKDVQEGVRRLENLEITDENRAVLGLHLRQPDHAISKSAVNSGQNQVGRSMAMKQHSQAPFFDDAIQGKPSLASAIPQAPKLGHLAWMQDLSVALDDSVPSLTLSGSTLSDSLLSPTDAESPRNTAESQGAHTIRPENTSNDGARAQDQPEASNEEDADGFGPAGSLSPDEQKATTSSGLRVPEYLWRVVHRANYFWRTPRGYPTDLQFSASREQQDLTYMVYECYRIGQDRPTPQHRANVELDVFRFLKRDIALARNDLSDAFAREMRRWDQMAVVVSRRELRGMVERFYGSSMQWSDLVYLLGKREEAIA